MTIMENLSKDGGSTSNAIIMLELLDFILKRDSRISGDYNHLSIKLNIIKAYDRVHWEYLEFMMRKFQFPDPFIRLCLKCVKATSIFSTG